MRPSALPALLIQSCRSWVGGGRSILRFRNAIRPTVSYALYALAAVLLVPFVWGFVRETRGKILEQM